MAPMNTLLTAPECLKNSLVDAMFKRFRCIFCLLIILRALFFSSCIDRLYGFETDYSTGVLLTPEMIDSIIDAATVEKIEKYSVETAENGELIVYWLSGGSVWHASKACSSVADGNNVKHGFVSDAIAEGKDRPCKICTKNLDYVQPNEEISSETEEDLTSVEETLKYPKDYSEDGTLLVYWTKSGSVWHESSSCSSLSKTAKDNLVCGSTDDAISAGKERACKKCS